MLRLRARRTMMSGVAIVVVIVMLTVSAIMGLGLHMYSLSTRFQVARTSYSTAAEYLCEAACEEGFYRAQLALNDPNHSDEDFGNLYDLIRNPTQGAFKAEYRPMYLLKKIQGKNYDGVSAEFPASGVEAEMQVEFAGNFCNLANCASEYHGTITFTASVKPQWTSGKTAFRKVRVKRSFKVVMLTPPHPFDMSALTMIHPDYINGESAEAMRNDMFIPANNGIDAHNKLCKLYKKTYDTAKDICPAKCSVCAGMPYLSGSPPFLAPRIPGSSKIPDNFWFNESILIGSLDREEFGKLIDFNYEDFLRETFPPLFNLFTTLLNIAGINGGVLVVTTALLGIVPGHEVCSTLDIAFGLGEVIRAIHSALEYIVPVQFGLGQVLLAAMKVVMEGLIIGSLFHQVDQAMQGNFVPMAEGAATFTGDLVASGALDGVDETTEGLDGINETAGSTDLTEGIDTSTLTDGELAAEGAEGAEGMDFGGMINDRAGEVEGDPTAFEGVFDQLGGLEGMEGNINQLGGQLSQGFDSSGNKAGPLAEMASDSDMSAMTGLIKGFVDSHRKFYTMEFPAGTAPFAELRTAFQAFDPQLWYDRATFYASTQEQVNGLLARYKDRGLCGILHYESADSLDIEADKFKGKFIVYSKGPMTVKKASLEDPKRDSVTFISSSTITIEDKKVEASFNAIGEKDSCLILGSGGIELLGNILLNHYRVADQRDRKSNERALKGSLKLNRRLNQREDDFKTVKASHLRVLISPGIVSQEVLVK